MRVFIDANTYIRLFEGRPSEEYLEKLEKLLTEKDKKFDLILPGITRQEVYRNVTKTLKEEAKEPAINFPSIPKIFSQDKLKEIEKAYQKEWSTEHKRQLKIKQEMAKKLFATFKELTVDYPENSEDLKNANERKVKRYSPGKSTDPLGDQLAWEIILKNCKDQDLIIVSSDADWRDELDGDEVKINPFILEEWENQAGENKIELVENLGDLIKKFESGYEIPKEEVEKEEFKKELSEFVTVGNFLLGTDRLGPNIGNVSSVPITPLNLGTTPSGVLLTPSSGASISIVGTSGINSLKCKNCGYYLSLGMLFCPSCGTRL